MRTILPEGENPALREISREIPLGEIPAAPIKKLIADMKKLLSKEEYGVALAASQVGEAVRLFIVSGKALTRGSRNSPDEPEQKGGGGEIHDDQVYINPEILRVSRERTGKHEGCLSVRNKWGIVPRSEKATIRAYDENGVLFTRNASGFLAHIFQHEMDHLDGTLYTDKATELYEENDTSPQG